MQQSDYFHTSRRKIVRKEKIFTRKLIVRATFPRRIEKEKKNTTHMPFFVTLGYPGENLTGMEAHKGRQMETKYLALTSVYKDRDRLIILFLSSTITE